MDKWRVIQAKARRKETRKRAYNEVMYNLLDEFLHDKYYTNILDVSMNDLKRLEGSIEYINWYNHKEGKNNGTQDN